MFIAHQMQSERAPEERHVLANMRLPVEPKKVMGPTYRHVAPPERKITSFVPAIERP